VSMPGLHSPAKLALRRERARARGYLVKKSPDTKLVEVPPALAPRVKAVAASLAVQAEHIGLAGKAHPVARQATRAARQHISPEGFRSAMAKKHGLANAANHRWSDMVIEGDLSPSPRGAAPAAVDAQTQTGFDDAVLSAEAPEYVPAGSYFVVYPDATPLFDAQNATIALLTSRLDELFPSRRRLRDLEQGFAAVRANVGELSKTLSPTVETKVREHLADAAADTNPRDILQKVDARYDALKVATVNLVRSSMEDFAAKSPDSLCKRFENLSERLLAMRPPMPSEAAPCGDDELPLSSPVFGLGDFVILHGLTSKPELNGRSATVISPLDGERIGVQLVDSGEKIRVRPQSVTLLSSPECGGPPSVPSGASSSSGTAAPLSSTSTRIKWTTSDGRVCG